jgi:hypothetical protein
MRHHYVPQFLLSKWIGTNTVTKNSVIEFRLRLRGSPARERPPSATGFEKDLLKLSSPSLTNDELHALETVVMKAVDTAAAPVLEILLKDGVRSLTTSQRCDWARFLNSIRLRQPRFVRHNVKERGAKQLEEEFSKDHEEYTILAGPGDPPTALEWVRENMPGRVENFGLGVVPAALDHLKTIERVINLNWGVCDFTRERNELLLSDNPLISLGSTKPEWVLALPISPTILFLACQADGTVKRLQDAKSSEIIKRVNQSSVNQATQWVYASSTAPQRFICNHVAKLRPTKPAS